MVYILLRQYLNLFLLLCINFHYLVGYIISGDIFEREDDVFNSQIWESLSSHPSQQRKSRRKIIMEADYIIPGHGPMFQVTSKMRDYLA